MNEANTSRELVVAEDGTMYVTVRSAGVYDLFRVHAHHVGTYKRKYEAVAAAKSGEHRQP